MKKKQFQRVRQEQANAQAPKGRQVIPDGQIARALENMERKMAMLEPSLQGLSELKGRMLAIALEMEELKRNLLLLMEGRRKGDIDGE
eukprot:5705202-Prorocentrum_lima.AAC.1